MGTGVFMAVLANQVEGENDQGDGSNKLQEGIAQCDECLV